MVAFGELWVLLEGAGEGGGSSVSVVVLDSILPCDSEDSLVSLRELPSVSCCVVSSLPEEPLDSVVECLPRKLKVYNMRKDNQAVVGKVVTPVLSQRPGVLSVCDVIVELLYS